MKGFLKAGLLAIFVGGVVALPIQEAEARTTCRTVYSHGVSKKICTTRPTYRYKTVCKHYYRNEVRYESCKKVKVRRRY